jgi:hypothetical protein
MLWVWLEQLREIDCQDLFPWLDMKKWGAKKGYVMCCCKAKRGGGGAMVKILYLPTPDINPVFIVIE